MNRQKVAVSQDHLERLAKCKPESAIEELIWNGLDAGGRGTEVRFELGGLTGDLIEAIEVEDHGTGIPLTSLSRAFATVGDSVKISLRTTREGRVLHGSEGKGRFKAFALGKKARWRTTYSDDSGTHTYDILVERSTIDYLHTTDLKPAQGSNTGTVLRIDEIDSGEAALLGERAREHLTERLALYLRQYPNTRVCYHGRHIDTNTVVTNSADYDLAGASEEGQSPTRLTVLEWTFEPSSKKLMFCDDDGFALSEMPAGVQARGINYTAYLRSGKIRGWHDTGKLALTEIDEEVRALIESAKDAIREHVRTRLAEEAQGLVQQWKDANVYPYAKDEAETPIQKAERQVFDIVATRVHEHHDPFRDADLRSKRFLLRLVREALESNPTSLHQILREVLELPVDQQDELADLLRKTDLKSIVQAVRTVTQRLDTIQGFERILFDKDWKQVLLERTQLHRLLVHQLWILGEDYTLDVDDESLREVLRKHLCHLQRAELALQVDVETIEN
ncbi:MAG: ATP-binding protein, partial [Planctomycetes bacterium]|nr:ATP-binding protein [Planctomycetota bacterium]